MGSLTTRPVNRLSARPADGASLSLSGIAFDYAIGGLPFIAASSPQHPLQRVTAPYKRDQIDTDAEPGEQTLVSWWLRSQSSFHAGTGLKFEEPDQNYPNNIYRFQDSLGVDPWTVGQLSLLPAMKSNSSSGTACLVHGVIDTNGDDRYLLAAGTVLSRGNDGSTTGPIVWGGTGTILALEDDGSNYYAADATGIYTGTLASPPGAGALLWNTGDTHVVLGWVKQRLMAGIGPSLYELTGAGPGLPAPKYTHPNPSWRWTAITETPNDIIASGYAGAQSTVVRFTLNTAGVVPTLTSAIPAMTMPGGEQVYSMYSYLGDYVALGTNKGVRIASVDDQSGLMQYGPLSILSTQPVRSLTGKDRFVYAACENQLNGKSGVWRLDMGTQTAFRRFAYATDLQTHVSGIVQTITQFGASGRLVVGVDGAGSFLEDNTARESTGYVQTGNIRFHTLEPKLFKYVRLRVTPLAGSIAVSVIDPSLDETTLATYSTAGAFKLDETAVNSNLGPQEYVNLRVTLTRDGVNVNTGPTFIGYQLKALPAAKRQRNFMLPLQCFDEEADKYGAATGWEGFAVSRLEALEALEEGSDTVLFQDLTRDPTTSRLCVIDEVKFIQSSPPTNASGWGGILYVTLRAVA